MRDGAQKAGAEPVEQHAVRAQSLERVVGLGDRDEVRLDRVQVDGYARICETLGETPCARVILGEAVDVVVERVERRGGEDAGLPHRAAEEVLALPGALDQLLR